MTEQVSVCPECEGPDIRVQTRRGNSKETHRCWDCDALFDEPVKRDRRKPGGVRGLAGRLLEAVPEEVSR